MCVWEFIRAVKYWGWRGEEVKGPIAQPALAANQEAVRVKPSAQIPHSLSLHKIRQCVHWIYIFADREFKQMSFSSEQGMTHLRVKVNHSFSFGLSSCFIVKPGGTLHLIIPKASHSLGQAQDGWNERPARVTPLTFPLLSTFSWSLILRIHSSNWWLLKSQIMKRQTSYRC